MKDEINLMKITLEYRRHLHTISVMCQQNSILIYFKPLFLIGCLISLAPNAHLNNDWHWLFKWIMSIHSQSSHKIYIVSQPITYKAWLITQPITDADKFPLGFSFVYFLTEYVILLKAFSFFLLFVSSLQNPQRK